MEEGQIRFGTVKRGGGSRLYLMDVDKNPNLQRDSRKKERGSKRQLRVGNSRKISMRNSFRFHQQRLSDIVRINSHDAYHDYLMREGVRRYEKARRAEGAGLGSVLAVCANFREAENLSGFPFSQIVLSSIGGINE